MALAPFRWLLRHVYGCTGLCQKKLRISASSSTIFGNRLKRDACIIFESAVQSVLPPAMIMNALHLEQDGQRLRVGQKTYDLHQNVYVVGFGKAVCGMVRAVEDLLSEHIVRGIASIPVGIQETLLATDKAYLLPSQDCKIVMREGAADNTADVAAYKTAELIALLVASLTANDLLLVLISGGGSALLPSPKPPMTLTDLITVSQLLSRGGGSIQEMNALRRCLEQLKGGGLSSLAQPAKVVALILPDVIGGSLDLIASGPTVPHASPSTAATQCRYLLDRFGDRVPASVWAVLDAMQAAGSPPAPPPLDDVQNVILGSNAMALAGAAVTAEQLGYHTHILSSELSGEARLIGADFARLGYFLLSCMMGEPSRTEVHALVNAGLVKADTLTRLQLIAECAAASDCPLCILSGGETTVTVRGTGRGGRNMEMVLAAAIAMQQHVYHRNLLFFSAGTDGQDGATDAAGALATPHLVDRANARKIDAASYLDNNDSYGFFSAYRHGKNLIRTGLTGTNVMDIQVLLVWPETESHPLKTPITTRIRWKSGTATKLHKGMSKISMSSRHQDFSPRRSAYN